MQHSDCVYAVPEPARSGGWGGIAPSYQSRLFVSPEVTIEEDHWSAIETDHALQSFFASTRVSCIPVFQTDVDAYVPTFAGNKIFGDVGTYPRICRAAILDGGMHRVETFFSTKPNGNLHFYASSILLTSLRTQKAQLLELKDDWDGYGAASPSPDLIEKIVSDLMAVLADRGEGLPDIIPGADGSVQAEWHLDQADLFYGYEEDGSRYFILSPKDSELLMWTGADAFTEFTSAADMYLRGGNDWSDVSSWFKLLAA